MNIYLTTREELFKDVLEQRIEEEELDFSVAMISHDVDYNEFRTRDSTKRKFVARFLIRPAELSSNSILSIIES